jgi:hypothetical protein
MRSTTCRLISGFWISENVPWIESDRNLMAPVCAGSLHSAWSTSVEVTARAGDDEDMALADLPPLLKTWVCVLT